MPAASAVNKAAAIPAKSLLFNIDQKATLISRSDRRPAQGVLSRSSTVRGYYGNQGAVAPLRRDLTTSVASTRPSKSRSASGFGDPRDQGGASRARWNIDSICRRAQRRGQTPASLAVPEVVRGLHRDFAKAVKAWLDKRQESGFG